MHPEDNAPTEANALQESASAPLAGDLLQPGTQLGVYVIRDVLGEGGMGHVYRAEQMQPVRREVALKLIRAQVASPLARAYFDVERQALAQMQHPAIAQVLDAGTTDQGHPYLAMEIVEGHPITEFCREEALDRVQRLVLFARVCHGVQHAHQKGIIHRDLKPANVLVRRVDGEPMPKIIDFGIAVGGAHAGAKVNIASVDRAGTAIYMSPEQSDRGVRTLDTRSDVYSLGVMLYEVLSGADAASLFSAAYGSARAPHVTLLAAIDSDADIANAPPDSAALLQAARGLPVELRAILRKSLAPDRTDRYDSAAALADDLERFREKRPVRALPQTRTYLARSFIARHRLGLIATSLVGAALLAGIALALHGLDRARASEAQARIEAAKAAQVSDFVQGILAGIDPDRAKGKDRALVHLLLDSAAQRAGRELADQPAVRASIERTIADSYAALGEFSAAATHYTASMEAGEAAGLKPGVRARTAIRAALNMDHDGRASEALVAAENAFALAAGLPASDRNRLNVESGLAGIEADAGKPELARNRYLRVLEQQRRLFGSASEDVLSTIDGLAAVDIDTGHLDDAQTLLQELLARRRAEYGNENSTTIRAINSLAIVALEQKRYADAEKLLAPQQAMVERVFGKDHPLTTRLISNLGAAIRQQGRNEEARPYYERVYEQNLKAQGPDSPNTVISESNLSLLLRDAGDLEAADAHARNAASHAQAAFGENAMRGIMYRELATILIRERLYAEAEKELDRAWAVMANAQGWGPQHTRSQDVVDSYIDLYAAWKKPDREAIWRARKVVKTAAVP